VSAAAQPWRALVYLYTRSWRNRMLMQVRRLKQPRYIVGALAMLAYVTSFFWSQARGSSGVTDPGLLDVRHLLTIIGLSVALVAWWLAAPSDNALAFSPAEVYFLFPAPVKRRTLVQARLMSVQALLLFQVLLWTLLLRRNSGDLNPGLRAAGLWLLFTTVALHRLGATLARTHAPDAPKRKPIARIIALIFLAVLSVALVTALPQAYAIWRDAVAGVGADTTHVLDRITAARVATQSLLSTPLLHVLLWPIRAVSTPAFAHSGREWLLALPGALAVLLLHYVWILRDPQPFEELALGASARFADRVARLRRGGGLEQLKPVRVHWQLATRGPPAVALAWKNVTAAIRSFRPRSLILALVIIVIIVVVIGRDGGVVDASRGALRSAFATTFVSVFAAALLTAPAWFKLDLRHDLNHLDFLKTAPLPAHTIVATEILTAAAITTAGMALLFAIPGFFLLRSLGGPLGSAGLALAIMGAVVALGAINLLHITLYNAVALWLPAWVPLAQGGSATGGASVVGQVYVTLIGILATLSLLLTPPVAAAWGIWWVLDHRIPVVAIGVLGGVLALSIVALEWLGLARLLGRALDRLEPSDVPSAQS
jgi:ABC-2 type transport system permease protein